MPREPALLRTQVWQRYLMAMVKFSALAGAKRAAVRMCNATSRCPHHQMSATHEYARAKLIERHGLKASNVRLG